jgi:DNA-binding MarR family transcriptional regulator
MKHIDRASAPGERTLLYIFLNVAQRQIAAVEDELRPLGLSPTMYETLAQLARADRPLTLRELAEGQRCAPSNITQKVDRLEGEGLVRRMPDPADRRVVLAVLTDTGRRRAREGATRVRRLARAFQAALPEGDRRGFTRALRTLASAGRLPSNVPK